MRQAPQEAAKSETAPKPKSRGGINGSSVKDRRAHSELLSGFISKPVSLKRAHNSTSAGEGQGPRFISPREFDELFQKISGKAAAVPVEGPRHSKRRCSSASFAEQPNCWTSLVTKSQQKPRSHNAPTAPGISKGPPFAPAVVSSPPLPFWPRSHTDTAPIGQENEIERKAEKYPSQDLQRDEKIASQSLQEEDQNVSILLQKKQRKRREKRKAAFLKRQKKDKEVALATSRCEQPRSHSAPPALANSIGPPLAPARAPTPPGYFRPIHRSVSGIQQPNERILQLQLEKQRKRREKRGAAFWKRQEREKISAHITPENQQLKKAASRLQVPIQTQPIRREAADRTTHNSEQIIYQLPREIDQPIAALEKDRNRDPNLKISEEVEQKENRIPANIQQKGKIQFTFHKEDLASQSQQEGKRFARQILQNKDQVVKKIKDQQENIQREKEQLATQSILQEKLQIQDQSQQKAEQIVSENQDPSPNISEEVAQKENRVAARIQRKKKLQFAFKKVLASYSPQKVKRLGRQFLQAKDQIIEKILDKDEEILAQQREKEKLALQSPQGSKSFASQILENKDQIVKKIEDQHEKIQREKEQLASQSHLGNKNISDHILQENLQNLTQIQDQGQQKAEQIVSENQDPSPNISEEVAQKENRVAARTKQKKKVRFSDQILIKIIDEHEEILAQQREKEKPASQSQQESKSLAHEILENKDQIVKKIEDQQEKIQSEKEQLAPQSHQGNNNISDHILQEKLQNLTLIQDQGQPKAEHIVSENQDPSPNISEEVAQKENQIVSENQDPSANISEEVAQKENQVAAKIVQKDKFQFASEISRQVVTSFQENGHQIDSSFVRNIANIVTGVTGAEKPNLAGPSNGQQQQAAGNSIFVAYVHIILKIIDRVCQIQKSKPADPNFNISGGALYLMRRKLAYISHILIDKSVEGTVTEENIAVLGDIVKILKDTQKSKPFGFEAKKEAEELRNTLYHEISMGFEILRRVRELITGWNKTKEGAPDTGDSGQGTESQNGAGRGGDHQTEGSNTAQKRRNQEDHPPVIKYQRVDNSFPRFITNVPAEDQVHASKSMAGRERENQQQGSKRLSVFNPPVYTQHRVRNDAPYIANPFDGSDDEEPSQPRGFANAAGTSARQPHMLYSDAVRLGQNGFPEARVNGHSAHPVRRVPTQVERSILTHEMERSEHEQYLNLIHTVAHNDSVVNRFAKPVAPPLQRINNQQPSWSSLLRGNQSRPLQQPQPLLQPSSLGRQNSVSEYARLINSGATQQGPVPAPPQLMRIDSSPNIAGSHASTISSTDGSNESGSDHSSSGSNSSVTAINDSSREKKHKHTNHIGSAKSLRAKTTRLSMTDALHRRFASCIYLKDDFVEQFKAKAARMREESEHRRELAVEEANRSTEERRAYEYKLRENIFQYRIPHKPIFVIGARDTPVQKKETKLIALTPEHLRRYEQLMYGGPEDEVLVVKFNMHIHRRDILSLKGTEWLNDEIINFYMCLLTDRSAKPELPNVYAMNTFFVPRLLQAGHAGVKRWTRKVDIFSKDVIPVPVHCNGVHWCMAIIHLRNKTIRYYDSMGAPNQAVLNALEAYLREESLDKRKQPFDTSVFVIENVPNVPQQLNGSDCGVFSCMFAEYISRDAPITFSQAEMEYFRKKMVLEIVAGELWN
ncbi:uncharacterized protein LOC119556330 isoform X2 [Drosophila subpulchrella]|nr:uncharacterized protein LOC119556330 isoform X2 [Drosophila subpulchrella]